MLVSCLRLNNLWLSWALPLGGIPSYLASQELGCGLQRWVWSVASGVPLQSWGTGLGCGLCRAGHHLTRANARPAPFPQTFKPEMFEPAALPGSHSLRCCPPLAGTHGHTPVQSGGAERWPCTVPPLHNKGCMWDVPVGQYKAGTKAASFPSCIYLHAIFFLLLIFLHLDLAISVFHLSPKFSSFDLNGAEE